MNSAKDKSKQRLLANVDVDICLNDHNHVLIKNSCMMTSDEFSIQTTIVKQTLLSMESKIVRGHIVCYFNIQ